MVCAVAWASNGSKTLCLLLPNMANHYEREDSSQDRHLACLSSELKLTCLRQKLELTGWKPVLRDGFRGEAPAQVKMRELSSGGCSGDS